MKMYEVNCVYTRDGQPDDRSKTFKTIKEARQHFKDFVLYYFDLDHYKNEDWDEINGESPENAKINLDTDTRFSAIKYADYNIEASINEIDVKQSLFNVYCECQDEENMDIEELTDYGGVYINKDYGSEDSAKKAYFKFIDEYLIDYQEYLDRDGPNHDDFIITLVDGKKVLVKSEADLKNNIKNSRRITTMADGYSFIAEYSNKDEKETVKESIEAKSTYDILDAFDDLDKLNK